MSVSRQTTSRPARAPSSTIGSARLPRVVERLHERAVADLDVEHDRVRARGELLRHDRRGDQRDAVDGRGDVAQRVELLVRGHEVAGLPDDREPDVAHLRDELVDRRARRGSPGSTRACRACRRCGRARGRTSSRTARRTRRRSARPRARSCPPRRRSSACRRPCGRAPRRGRASRRSRIIASVSAYVSRAGQPAEVDGHAERGHLVVGHLAARVAEDELGDLVVGELLAVALALDQLRGADHSSI